MFRMWGKIFHENHMLKDTVICIDSDLNRTRKVYQALEEICYEFDLSKPLWLCLLYTSPSPRDKRQSRMPSSA